MSHRRRRRPDKHLSTTLPENNNQTGEKPSINRENVTAALTVNSPAAPHSTPAAKPTPASRQTEKTHGHALNIVDQANDRLPVLRYREQIVESVKNNPVTIITAETGAGKSTCVPVFLQEAGYKVIVTQPRRLAASSVAARVAQTTGSRLGERVGYRTAEDRCDSAVTKILFCTDGLQLVRELTGQQAAGGKTVLVLDEVHEWNINMEVLIAWAKQRQQRGDDLKIVVMSATIDSDQLAGFFNHNTPAIEVPGRLYPVEKSEKNAEALVEETVRLAKEGRNVLVFQPGKKEINEIVETLGRQLAGQATVLPLHGELTREEQQRCFAPAPFGKSKVVVATNVAQTSVTIPDIDAVVDSGLEKRIELADGIEGLYLKPISRADCLQRAGRAGRCKEGHYVLCAQDSLDNRPPFPTAEIMRSRLDQVVLRLAAQGFDAAALEFFHQPDRATIAEAKRALVFFGAMTEKGEVTAIGRRIAKMPVSVQFGRMLLEAEKLGVVEEVATIAACLEAGDILSRPRNGERPAWGEFTQETGSDLLALLDVYEAGSRIGGGNGYSKADKLRNMGIFAKDFFRAGEIRRRLLALMPRNNQQSSTRPKDAAQKRQAILKCCVAGMSDHLFVKRSRDSYENGGGGYRELGRESLCQGSLPELLIGLPHDIQISTRRGPRTLKLIRMASAITPEQLAEVSPHLVRRETGLHPVYDPIMDSVYSKTRTYFQERPIGDQKTADPQHPEAAELFANWLANSYRLSDGHPISLIHNANLEQLQHIRKLNTRNGIDILETPDLSAFYRQQLQGAVNKAAVRDVEALKLPPLDTEIVELLEHDYPDQVTVFGESFPITYQAGAMPVISLSDTLISSGSFMKLPDEGLFLPGGKQLQLCGHVCAQGYYKSVYEADVPRFKQLILGYLNEQALKDWTERPEIALPDTDSADAVIPEILSCSYGHCSLTGQELIAHGTMACNPNRYYTTDPKFVVLWYRDRQEAEKARTEALAKLTEITALEREKQLKIRNEALIEARKEEIRDLINQEPQAYGETRHKLDDLLFSYIGYQAASQNAWLENTAGLIGQYRQEVASLKEQNEANERQRAVEEAHRNQLAEKYQIDLSLLSTAQDFVREATAVTGSAQLALTVIRNQSEAPYGRARRQSALREVLGDDYNNTAIEKVLGFGKAASLDAVLHASVLILEEQCTQPRQHASVQQRQATSAASTASPEETSQATCRDISQLFGGQAKIQGRKKR